MAQPVKSMNNLPRELLRSEIARYLDPKSLVCLKVASVRLCMLANDATLESCAHLTGLPVGLAIKRVIDWVKCEDLGPIYEDEYNDVLVESSYHGPPAAPLNLSRRSIFALNSPNKSILTRSAIEYYAWLLQRLQMARMPFSTSDYGDLRIRPMLFSGPRYIDYGGDKGAKPIPGCNPHGRINVGADPNCLAAVGPVMQLLLLRRLSRIEGMEHLGVSLVGVCIYLRIRYFMPLCTKFAGKYFYMLPFFKKSNEPTLLLYFTGALAAHWTRRMANEVSTNARTWYLCVGVLRWCKSFPCQSTRAAPARRRR